MSIRLLSCLWLGGCALSAIDDPEQAASELAAAPRTRPVIRARARRLGPLACVGAACSHSGDETPVGRGDGHERSVRIMTRTATPPPVEVMVELPTIVLIDCSQVQLSVVGPWRAEIGESLELAATTSGVEEGATLAWAMAGGEITELGPLTASVTCTEPGTHVLRVEFAPPAPCPSPLEMEIDCESPAQ